MSTNHTVDCPSCSSIKPEPASHDKDVRLTQWPIQIKLIGTVAPFLKDADLLVAADCTAFATPGFHEKFLPGKKVLISAAASTSSATWKRCALSISSRASTRVSFPSLWLQ